MRRGSIVISRSGYGSEAWALKCFVPETGLERARGLEAFNGRGLMDDEAMVFVYDPPEVASIHMAAVSFPIDVVFVGADGRVTAIAEDIRPGSQSRWATHAALVLELRSGWWGSRGLDRQAMVGRLILGGA